jgi:hypothetical protein
MPEPKRPGKEWKQWDKVCPRRLAQEGHFVEGTIVQACEIGGYTPPASYEYQTHIYIVEWSAPIPGAELKMDADVFLGNDLMTLEAGAKRALEAIKKKRELALEALHLGDAEHKTMRFLEELERKKPRGPATYTQFDRGGFND